MDLWFNDGDWFAAGVEKGRLVSTFGPLEDSEVETLKTGGTIDENALTQKWVDPRSLTTTDIVGGERETAGSASGSRSTGSHNRTGH